MPDQPPKPPDMNVGVTIDKASGTSPVPPANTPDSVTQEYMRLQERVQRFRQTFSVVAGLLLAIFSTVEVSLTQWPKYQLMEEQVESQHEALRSQKEQLQAEIREMRFLHEENQILKNEAETLRKQTKNLKASLRSDHNYSDNCVELDVDDHQAALIKDFIDAKE